MQTFKRIVAWIVVILAVVGMVIVIGSMIGSWIINSQVTTATLNLLTAGEKALIATSEGVGRIDGRLDVTHERINNIDEVVLTAGDELKETSLVAELISKTIGDQLAPIVESIGDTADTLRGTATAIDAAIEAADAIPFISFDKITPGANVFTEIADSIDEIETSIEETRTDIKNRREERVEDVVTEVTGKTDEWRGKVDNIQTRLGEANTNLNSSLTNLGELKTTLARTFFMLTMAFNVALLFIGLALLSLFFHGIAYLRNSDQSLKELLL